jgi:hypothetical protein
VTAQNPARVPFAPRPCGFAANSIPSSKNRCPTDCCPLQKKFAIFSKLSNLSDIVLVESMFFEILQRERRAGGIKKEELKNGRMHAKVVGGGESFRSIPTKKKNFAALRLCDFALKLPPVAPSQSQSK